MFRPFIAYAALALVIGTPASAATLLTDSDGILIGATGVNVNGDFYDVSFVDGTCADVFSGCDTLSDFDFGSLSDAYYATAALYSQVFIEPYRTDADAVRGCDEGGEPYCWAFVPTGGFVNVNGGTQAQVLFSDVNNILGYGPGQIFQTATPADLDWATAEWVTWAKFTPAIVASVPEPSTWAMMLLGFAGIGFAMRRQRRTAPPVAA